MTTSSDPIWRMQAGALLLRVRLTPKSARDLVEGIETTAEGPALKVRVRAVPQDGEANAALEGVVARWLGMPRSVVSVTRGGKSRLKTLQVTGDPDNIRQAIEERCQSWATGAPGRTS